MYINPIVIGVVGTLMIEVCIAIIYSIWKGGK